MSHKPRPKNLSFHEALIQRIELSGDTTSAAWSLAADLVRICAIYMSQWTNRSDDASRIPDVLNAAADTLRGVANDAARRG